MRKGRVSDTQYRLVGRESAYARRDREDSRYRRSARRATTSRTLPRDPWRQPPQWGGNQGWDHWQRWDGTPQRRAHPGTGNAPIDILLAQPTLPVTTTSDSPAIGMRDASYARPGRDFRQPSSTVISGFFRAPAWARALACRTDLAGCPTVALRAFRFILRLVATRRAPSAPKGPTQPSRTERPAAIAARWKGRKAPAPAWRRAAPWWREKIA